ncbi:MAG TPA: cytochrome c biogenesis protein DipZ [Patescibacteria group bacterium]|nr:cytochrome c biogenesis protein DipZ [Patescibacteria group bacterium]
MIALLFFAFLSGLVTIAAPCIWPLLPIVLSSSALGGHRRPLGLTLGILTSFGLITLSISYLVKLLGFDANLLRLIAVIILLFLGLTLLLPPLTRIVEGLVSRFAGRFGGANTGTGFWPGFLAGLALGVVWAPCAGPILATIATLSATRAVGFQIIIVTIVYLIGVGIPLFIFSYAGQKFIQKSRVFNKYTGVVQKIFGVIIILTALLIFTNYDKVIAANLLDAVPSYSNFINNLEGNSAVTKELNAIKGNKTDNNSESNSELFNVNYPAPELTGINHWLNLPAGRQVLSLSDLKGKVVLVDFWTYTCINCIRTLPFVTSWYDKYNKDGFVVIGVHTPEFEFEHDTNNVANAIKQYGIHYPVAQDNDYATWNAFKNQYWPAEYLIDKNGNVRRTHFGEGEYDQTEEAIRELLKENGASLSGGLVNKPDLTPKEQISPETYIGASRAQFYYPSGAIASGKYTNLKAGSNIPVNSYTLGGDWDIMDEYGVAGKNATLEYNFSADHVYLVMMPPKDGAGTINPDSIGVKVFIDGKPANSSNSGDDVTNGQVKIDQDRLYNLVDLKNKPGQYLLKLEFSPGIQVFAFTFG